MIKNLQKYLLLNYPLLWNLKIIPALICTVLINIFFFFLGYITTEISFSYNYYNNFFSNGILYFFACIATALVFILWLVFYSKNNAFKVFYPKKASSLYLEWLLIFVIILSSFSFVFSVHYGSVTKTRSNASEKEMLDAIETINMVKILIPTNKTDYFQEYPSEIHEARMNKKGQTIPYLSELEIDSINNISGNVHYEDYPNFSQLSLLNYNIGYDEIYIPEEYNYKLKDTKLVKQWLVNNDSEKIKSLMNSFLKLVDKHHLKTNLTVDQWFNLIYNPQKFPVGDFNLIVNSSYEDDSYHRGAYYLPYYQLKNGYDDIKSSYTTDNLEMFIYVTLCFAILFSLFVFGFRSTSGKAWLIALISMGLLLFIDGLLCLTVSGSSYDSAPLLFYLFVLIIVFLFEFITIINKNRLRMNKGKSDIFANHLLAFIPIIPVVIYLIIYSISYDNRIPYDIDDNTNNSSLYLFMKEHTMMFSWMNIGLTFVTVWLFIKFVLLKWKSLPEE